MEYRRGRIVSAPVPLRRSELEADSPRSAHLDRGASETKGRRRQCAVPRDLQTVDRLRPPRVQVARHAVADVAGVAIDDDPAREEHPPVAVPSAEVEIDPKGGFLPLVTRAEMRPHAGRREYADPVAAKPRRARRGGRH